MVVVMVMVMVEGWGVTICNIIFLIENDPPPLSELFRKFIRFGNGRPY